MKHQTWANTQTNKLTLKPNVRLEVLWRYQYCRPILWYSTQLPTKTNTLDISVVPRGEGNVSRYEFSIKIK